MAVAKGYYSGGHRIMLGGVPCRIACKPHSKNHADLLRQGARNFCGSNKTNNTGKGYKGVDGLFEKEAYEQAARYPA